MGDLVSPKRRDVFDRLRRRLDEYRRRHEVGSSRYEPTANGLYDQQRHDTLQLHQRWLESRAKRAAKQAKVNKQDPCHSDQQGRATALTQRGTKRKLDHGTATEGANVETLSSFNVDETGGSPGPTNSTAPSQTTASCSSSTEARVDGNHLRSSVSVNIVQQFSNQKDQQIKLTVSSTLQASGSGSPGLGPATGLGHTSTSVQANTNICKQEPLDDSNAHSSDSSQTNLADAIGLEDIDELQAILDTLEKEEGEIPPDLIKEIDKDLEEACEGSNLSDKDSTADLSKSPMFGGSGAKSTSPPASGMFADPLYDSVAPTNPNLNMGGQGAAAMTYQRPSPGGGAAPPPGILGDTGPAAETLKQMAAQHQSHENYGMKSYGSEFAHDGYNGRPTQAGYPAYPAPSFSPMQGGATPNNMYPYSHQAASQMNGMHPAAARQAQMAMQPGAMVKHDPSMNYRETKPLSHYPGEQSSTSGAPSSLQQLQKQVQSHFSQAPGPGPAGMAPHLQITQSQHIHMTQGGPQHMHMSQTQQMQVGTGQPIAVAQQQSFNMGGMPQNHAYINEQMKMRMYQEKMRQEQAMGGYMQRPPPEYKGGPGMNGTYPHANMQPVNPLQTMQNMVNQTSGNQMPMQNGMYMKTEAGMPTQMPTHMPTSGNSSPLPQSYPRPQMMPSQMAAQTDTNVSKHSMKSTTPTYTSAVMRGQRPPNVNVGPDGLNISQQRPHSAEWGTRGPMGMNVAGGQQAGPRTPMGGNAGMMPYAAYQSQTAMMAGNGERLQMSQHQMAAQHAQMQQMHPRMGAQKMPPGMAMAQQQGMHMQGAGGHPMGAMNMSQTMSNSSAGQQAAAQMMQQQHAVARQHPGQQQQHPGQQQQHPGQQQQQQQQQHPGQQPGQHAAMHHGQPQPGQQVHPGQQQHPASTQQRQQQQQQSNQQQAQQPQQQSQPQQQQLSGQQQQQLRPSSHPSQQQQQQQPQQAPTHPDAQAQHVAGQQRLPSTSNSSPYPQTATNGQSDFPSLDFLDNPQQPNPDFFDTNPPDLFDELFGAK